jgi:hypothetical protein
MSPTRLQCQVLVSTICFSALTVAGSLVTNIARADVPPPEGYVETCTVEQQQNATTLCEACGAAQSNWQLCTTRYASTPFEQRCRTRGASVWTEVWCRPREAAAAVEPHQQVPEDRLAPAPPTPAPPAAAATAAAEDDSCSVAAPGAGRGQRSMPWQLAGAFVLLMVVRARRALRRAG